MQRTVGEIIRQRDAELRKRVSEWWARGGQCQTCAKVRAATASVAGKLTRNG